MAKLIILPGTVQSSFFINEYIFLQKFFKDICVISFQGNLQKEKEAFEKYNMRGTICRCNLLSLKKILKIVKWLRREDVKKEIRENINLSVRGFKKFVYLLMYGVHSIEVKEVIEEEVKGYKGDVILYSFWLTRGAYCIADFEYELQSGKMKKISRAHGYDVYLERNSCHYLPFRKYINENLDEIYFISANGKNYFEKNFCSQNDDSRAALRKVNRLGTYNKEGVRKKIKEKSEIVIASCSSIIEVKRLDIIIDLIAYLINSGINVKWTHIGDGSEKEKVLQYALQKIDEKDFAFLGNVSNDEILSVYIEKDVDFFINMSDSEGIPVSVMEALSVGIPAIGRDVGGMSEIIKEECGMLISGVPQNSFENIAIYIEKRISNVNEYKKHSMKAYEQWKENFNANENYRNFIDEILNS